MQKCPIDEETGNELLSGIALSVRVKAFSCWLQIREGD